MEREKCVHRDSETGKRCGSWPIKGGTVCYQHGGAAKHVRVNAAVRHEVSKWTLGDATVDPGEVLLRLVSQSASRAERYAQEIERMVEEAPDLNAALVGETCIPTKDAGSYKAGEYIRGLAQLEAQERDRCANFAAKAIAAGLNERMVRVAEAQGAMLVKVLRAVLDDPGLELTEGQKEVARVGLAREMRAISAA